MAVSLVVIGASHRTAPLWFLEALSLDAPAAGKLADSLVGGAHISEAVVLSTCNRTELYLAAETFHGAYGEARNAIADVTFLGPESFADHMIVLHDEDAVRHLLEVTAGLDSVVVGEHEIIGQVRSAWTAATERGTAGSTLGLLFRHAIEAGKRARTDTSISRSTASIPHAAVDLAASHLGGSVAGRRALVVGAGEMATSAVQALASRGASVTILNRTISTAEALAERHRARALGLGALSSELVGADLVVTATSAFAPWIVADDLAGALTDRHGSPRTDPLVLVDIAMPRDIDPAVRDLDGVVLADMDDLRAFVDANLESRRREVPAVRSIIAEEIERYLAAAGSREVAPLVAAMRGRAMGIRDGELARFSSRIDAMTPEARATLGAVLAGVLGKLLHEPTAALKESAATPRGDRLAAALRELFDL